MIFTALTKGHPNFFLQSSPFPPAVFFNTVLAAQYTCVLAIAVLSSLITHTFVVQFSHFCTVLHLAAIYSFDQRSSKLFFRNPAPSHQQNCFIFTWQPDLYLTACPMHPKIYSAFLHGFRSLVLKCQKKKFPYIVIAKCTQSAPCALECFQYFS